MTRAYAETYLNDAMRNLGEAFDYAVNACQIDIETFMGLFISSGYADLFGKGVPKVVTGMSGTELVMEIVNKAGAIYSFPEPQVEYDFSPEYWCGWILAYYQWATGRTFKDIEVNLSISEVLKMYPTFHEAAEEKFVDSAIKLKNKITAKLLSAFFCITGRSYNGFDTGAGYHQYTIDVAKNYEITED